MRATLTVTAFFLLGAGLLRPCPAEGGSVAASCPAYRTHLRHARRSLERGDRRGAVAALLQAQETLRACIREDAEEIAVACSSRRDPPLG